jgi:hypothetical protein
MPLYEFQCPVCGKIYCYIMKHQEWVDCEHRDCPTPGCEDQMGTHPGLQKIVPAMGKAVVK